MIEVYKGFANKADIEKEFQCQLPADTRVLLAYYSQDNYGGDAFVLYLSGGKIWEAHGDH